MVRRLKPGLWIGAIALLLMSGCATTPVDTEQIEFTPDETGVAPIAQQQAVAPHPPKAPVKPARKDFSTVRRVITEKEVRKLKEKDPALEFYRCIEILCRLNKKDKEYVREDMKLKRPLIVPKNFSSYNDWSPLPGNITGAARFPKLILVVKDINFLGWYQNGRLVSDTYVCIGKMNAWTKRGMYRVKEKDPSHISTYPNAYGYPAVMPNALHIYDRVWIHTGDVIGPNCSHGCINVPIAHAEKLYSWANVGTAVLITESLKNLGRDIKTAPLENRPQKAPSAKVQGTEDKKLKSANETPKQFPGNSNKTVTGGI
ncbi:MAG: L,D-transpeptidase [Syntrophobacteraceae bacterium]|jgi:lipoprotein-anchoring transpeptidase ErfK/SrfK